MNPLDDLDVASELALAWQPIASRPALAALFALDAHLGRLVAQASEPLLAQMRLAWWRERLAAPLDERPAGEPVLAALAQTWNDGGSALTALVDGFEELLDDDPLPSETIGRFAKGRGRALAAFAMQSGLADASDAASGIGRKWALADFAYRTSSLAERETALASAEQPERTTRLPKALRGVAVLGALADRAIARAEPLGTGRGAALVALRVGMTGR